MPKTDWSRVPAEEGIQNVPDGIRLDNLMKRMTFDLSNFPNVILSAEDARFVLFKLAELIELCGIVARTEFREKLEEQARRERAAK